MDNLSELVIIALFLVAITLIEYMNYKKDRAVEKEREQLLDRIQAKDYIEYKKMDSVAEIKPKEVKKPVNYI
jgi:preprotein translocase subunit YajC